MKAYRKSRNSVFWFGMCTATLAAMLLFGLITATVVEAGVIGPGDFGPGAEVEDFEGLANVVFTEILPIGNPHYVVTNAYSFNGDFSLTQPDPNPPTPGSTNGAVLIGDFTQGTQFWALGHRTLNDAGDVYSGSAYLGFNSKVSTNTMLFNFKSALLRVGAWVDGYSDNLATLSALDINGFAIASVSTEPYYWTFLGIESQTPIWGVSITGRVPVVDDLTYEVPEPGTMILLGLGSLTLLKQRRHTKA